MGSTISFESDWKAAAVYPADALFNALYSELHRLAKRELARQRIVRQA